MKDKNNKTKKTPKIIILDDTNIPRDESLFIQISRELILDKLFYANYNLDKEFIERRIKEIEEFYMTKINSTGIDDSKKNTKKLLERKDLKIKQVIDEPLFKDPDMNNRALLVITHLCFCRQMKGNKPTKVGRKSKEQENMIFCNKNNELRINIKDFTMSLGYSGIFKQVAKIKEVLVELDRLKWIKFKKYESVKDIYTITLDDEIFNYKTKEVVENLEDKEVQIIKKVDKGFIKFNAEEYFLIIENIETEKNCKTFNLLSAYLALKESSPIKDIQNIKSLSYLELTEKTNISNVTLINSIENLEKRKLIKVTRGKCVCYGEMVSKPKNIYTLLF